MNHKDWRVIVAACAVAAAAAWGPEPASAADSGEAAKEKPALYTYEANWAIPRAHWADYEKSGASTSKVLDQAVSSGAIVAYGSDSDLIHTEDGGTHDDWWSALSEAGVLNTLDAIYKAGGGTSPALVSATKHWDNLWVSHHYGWHAGSWKGAYTHWSSYNLKADAPDDAVSTIAKVFIEPLMEKLLADGTIVEYEIDEEAIHTQNPDLFAISYITTSAEGLDKAQAALRDAVKKTPLIGPAMDGMVDFTKHRDGLARTTATYK